MNLPIRWYGDPVLRRKAEEVDPSDGRLDGLIRDMIETMHEGDGIGLAAPQVGRSERLIVIDGSAFDGDEPRAFLNPRILESSKGRVLYEEGCLSLPDLRADVERPEAVRVRYRTESGEEVEEEAEGLYARVLQHEIDHLDGVLFVDRLGAARRALLAKRLREIQRKTEMRVLEEPPDGR
ncbi:MAG: peptide deformylase [Candidatus Eisenbacteria bacterium]|nr:peptide deformylase [Candidatus Eisenbacteria bacterium]